MSARKDKKSEEFVKVFTLQNVEKAEEDSNIYEIEGVASVTGVIDKTGELIEHGAFDESVAKVVPLWVMHNGVRSTIGSAELNLEGDKLIFKGKIYDDVELGRAIAKNKADGVKFNVSIGGRRTDYSWETRDDQFLLVTKKINVREISITGEDQQAHQDAVVTKTDNLGGQEMDPKEIQKIIDAAVEAVTAANTKEDISKALAGLTEIKAELAKGGNNEEAAEMQKTITSLTGAVANLEKQLAETKKINHNRDNPGAIGEEITKFDKYLRSNGLDAAELQKAVDTTSAGKLIPQLLVNEIIKDVKAASPFFAKAKMYTGSRPEVDIPVRKAWTNVVNATAEGTETATKGSFGVDLLTIKAGKLQSEIEITDEMREDTDFDLVAEIREVNTEDFAEYISDKIIRGVVGSTNQIEGFLSNTTVTTGALSTAASGVIAYDDLINLEMSLKASDRVGAAYFVSRGGLTKMKTMKDGMQRPVWQPSLVPGAPSTFNGYPVFECPDMDSVAANNFPILFANFGLFYATYLRKGMETEMDRKASAGKDVHITRMRMGGKVRKASSGKLLKVKP